MSHEIYIANNRASMAYVGKTPWHGLGQQLEIGASLETWIQNAGFEYEILSAPVQYQFNGDLLTAESRNVLYRDDSGKALGFVSDRYKVVQPAEVMDFFRDLTADFGYQMETAGVLKDGAVYWALAKTGQTCTIAGDNDRINGYVLLSTACDGSMATTAKLTSVRVVCNNTLSMAMHNSKGETVKTRHSTDFKPDNVKSQLKLIDTEKSWNDFSENLRQLADTHIDTETAKQYFRDLLQPKNTRRKDLQANDFASLLGTHASFGEHKTEVAKEPRGFEPMYQTYLHGQGQQGITGTAYGLLNAVTRYVDHERNQGNPQGRLHSAWFAQGAEMKQRAMDSALKLA